MTTRARIAATWLLAAAAVGGTFVGWRRADAGEDAAPVPNEAGRRLLVRTVDAQTGEPIAGALVSTRPQSLYERDQILESRTDASGRAEFTGLEPQVYFVWATRGVLTSLIDGPKDHAVADLRLAGVLEREIELPMVEAAALTVAVTARATGKPIEGAEVTLRSFSSSRGAETDARGMADLAPVSPENYWVSASAPGFVAASKKIDITLEEKFPKVELALEAGGAVFGRVTREDGTPVEGIMVVGRGGEFDHSRFMSTTKTDAEGNYRLESLPFDRKIKVSIGTNGWAADKKGRRYQGKIEKATIGADAPEADVDLVLKLTGDLEPEENPGVVLGRVVDEAGRPIVGAKVYVWLQMLEGDELTTDEEGRFVLEKPTFRGTKTANLVIWAFGYAPLHVRAERKPRDEARETAYELKKGRWIEGRVVDEKGRPVERVEIEPSTIFPGYSSFINLYALRTYTDAEGRFRIESLPEVLALSFKAEGYAEIKERKVAVDRDFGDIVMQTESVFRGRVVDAETGEPIEAFYAKLSPEKETESPFPPEAFEIEFGEGPKRENHESEDGLFEVAAPLPPGQKVTVQIGADGYASRMFHHLEMKSREEADPVELELHREGQALGGMVVDSEGRPIADAEAMAVVYEAYRSASRDPNHDISFALFDMSEDDYGFRGFYHREQTRTGADGTFRLERLPVKEERKWPSSSVRKDWTYPWAVDLYVRAEGFAPRRIVEFEEKPTSEWETTVVELHRPARLFGRVNREKLPRAFFVRLAKPSGEEDRETDRQVRLEQGEEEYAVENLSAGKYMVQLEGNASWSGNHEPDILRIPIEVAEGEQKELNIGFGDYPSLSGRVFFEGEPMAKGRVDLTGDPESNPIRRVAETDEFGVFTIAYLPPGEYSLFAHPGKRTDDPSVRNVPEYAQSVEIGESDLPAPRLRQAGATGEFHFGKMATVRGRIAGVEERGVQKLYLNLQKNGSEYAGSPRAEIARDGAFEFVNLAPGSYVLRLNDDNRVRANLVEDIVVTRGADLDLGDIETGSIEFHFDGLPEGRKLISVAAVPVSTPPENWPSYWDALARVSVGDFEDETIRADFIPPGDLRLMGGGLGWRPDPITRNVTVKPGETTAVDWKLVPFTWMGVEADRRLASAQLIDADGGEPLDFVDRTGVADFSSSVYTDRTLYLFNTRSEGKEGGVMATNVPPGRWTLRVVAEDGATAEREVELVPGKPMLNEKIAFE